MKTGSVLIRRDGVKFKAIEVNHWTLVMSMKIGDTAEDRVKWYGSDESGKEMYVGHSSGYTYTLTDEVVEV